jgi:hypothetical protein
MDLLKTLKTGTCVATVIMKIQLAIFQVHSLGLPETVKRAPTGREVDVKAVNKANFCEILANWVR